MKIVNHPLILNQLKLKQASIRHCCSTQRKLKIWIDKGDDHESSTCLLCVCARVYMFRKKNSTKMDIQTKDSPQKIILYKHLKQLNISINVNITNWIQSGTTVEKPLLQSLRCMWHKRPRHLSIDRQWLCLFVNHNGFCAHQDLFRIPALQHHIEISLSMNHGTRIDGLMIHVVPNSKWAVHRLLCIRQKIRQIN